MKLTTISLILLSTIAIFKTVCQYQKPSLSINLKFTQTGFKNLQINNQTTVSENYDLPYYHFVSEKPPLYFIGIQSLSFNWKKNLDIYVEALTVGTTSITVRVHSKYPSGINKLTVRYFIALKQYSQSPTFSTFNETLNSNWNLSSFSPYKTIISLSTEVNMTAGIETFYALTGLNVTWSSQECSLYLRVNRTASSTAEIQLFSQSNSSALVESIRFFAFSYNIVAANRPIFGKYVLSPPQIVVEKDSLPSLSTDEELQFERTQTLTAMTGFNFNFEIIVQKKIKKTIFKDYTQIEISIQRRTIPKKIELLKLLMMTFYCKQTSPYLYTSSPQPQRCVASCPEKTYAHKGELVCKPCDYDCATCVINGTCTSCSAADHRQLNNITQKCDHIPALKSTGAAFKSPCPLHCISCQNNSVCQQCEQGYFLSNTLEQCLNRQKSISGNVNSMIGVLVVSSIVVIIIVFTLLLIYKKRQIIAIEPLAPPVSQTIKKRYNIIMRESVFFDYSITCQNENRNKQSFPLFRKTQNNQNKP